MPLSPTTLNKTSMYYHRNRSGVALVEVLVYLFLLTVIVAAALSVVMVLYKLNTESQEKRILFNSGTMLLERVLLEIREAESVVLAESVVASTTYSVLTLQRQGDKIELMWKNGEITSAVNGGPQTTLHDDRIQITGATFYVYESDGKQLVRVKTDLAPVGGGEGLSLSGGAIVRGTYEEN